MLPITVDLEEVFVAVANAGAKSILLPIQSAAEYALLKKELQEEVSLREFWCGGVGDTFCSQVFLKNAGAQRASSFEKLVSKGKPPTCAWETLMMLFRCIYEQGKIVTSQSVHGYTTLPCIQKKDMLCRFYVPPVSSVVRFHSSSDLLIA